MRAILLLLVIAFIECRKHAAVVALFDPGKVDALFDPGKVDDAPACRTGAKNTLCSASFLKRIWKKHDHGDLKDIDPPMKRDKRRFPVL